MEPFWGGEGKVGGVPHRDLMLGMDLLPAGQETGAKNITP